MEVRWNKTNQIVHFPIPDISSDLSNESRDQVNDCGIKIVL